MFKFITNLFKEKPHIPKEYNVGRIIAEINFENEFMQPIKKEFVGFVHKHVFARNGFSVVDTVSAQIIFNDFKVALTKGGFISYDGKEIPVSKIKYINKTYEDFTIIY